MKAEVAALYAELTEAFPGAQRVQVAIDRFGGLRVTVVSDEFSGLMLHERRRLAPAAIGGDSVDQALFLTPEEAELVEDGEPDQTSLPLWPDALALGESAKSAESDYNQLSPPVVVTFYSLRGGVGRSTGLVHTGRLLAAQGLSVLYIDMDLEAPGLAALLELEDEIPPSSGVVSLLLQAEIAGEMPDVSEHILRVPSERDERAYLLPAGRPTADYARRLALIDPAAWYQEEVNPLRLLIAELSRIPQKPDVVLIDSRTGISPLAAPLLFDVSDMAVIAFYPHEQARAGTAAITRALMTARSRRSTSERVVHPEIRFLVSPVPASREAQSLYEEMARGWVGEWLGVNEAEGDLPFPVEELLQLVPYKESIASSRSAIAVDSPREFETTAAWVAGLLEPSVSTWPSEPSSGDAAPDKAEVLAELRFSEETAERQEFSQLLETFLSTDQVERALDPETPLVLGRKGTGKTAIFRKLASQAGALVITGPSAADRVPDWSPSANLYAAFEETALRSNLEWRQLWPSIWVLALLQHSVMPGTLPAWCPEDLGEPSGARYRGSDFKRDLVRLMKVDGAPLLIQEWLEDISVGLDAPIALLFDGLDTGFGNADEDRRRRKRGVAGLLESVNSIGPRVPNLKFKILLREDIWRDVSFPNKSHLEAQAVRLTWSNQMDYVKIAIKQATRCSSYARLVSARLGRPNFDPLGTDVEYWPEDTIRQAWVILAGDRVSGGRTAYTHNWVWARLADANGDHSPRQLAQLLNAASGRERGFETINPYGRSILRPRALVESLDDVSEKALDALRRDEFPELEPLFEVLDRVNSTPFDADQISSVSGLIPLAREVGLLEPLDGAKEGVSRYRVPELYRKALNMGRRGQA